MYKVFKNNYTILTLNHQVPTGHYVTKIDKLFIFTFRLTTNTIQSLIIQSVYTNKKWQKIGQV